MNKEGERLFSINCDDSIRQQELLCPHCRRKVLFVNPSEEIIKHFRHKTECPYQTEPETQEHIRMKLFFLDTIQKANQIKSIVPEHKIENSIADLFVVLKDNNKIAIECQYSGLTRREWVKRTIKYNKHGIYVLWIYHKEFISLGKSYSYETTFKRGALLENAYCTGRNYIFDDNLIVKPLRMQFTKRWNKKCYAKWGEPITNYTLLLADRKYKVARFYDRKFW